MFGSWCALGGAKRARWIIDLPVTLYFCIAYLILALVMTMAGKFPDFGALFPHWLYSTFNPNDKTNLAPYRFLHFVVIVIMVIRFVPKDWPGLEWKVFDPVVVCGQQSLAVFCVGVFLSFVGHFELMMSSGSLFAQIFVSVTGIAIMTMRRLLHLLVETAGQAAAEADAPAKAALNPAGSISALARRQADRPVSPACVLDSTMVATSV